MGRYEEPLQLQMHSLSSIPCPPPPPSLSSPPLCPPSLQVMNDRRHILTQDAEGDVALWDVLTGGEVQAFGKVIWVAGGARRRQGVYFTILALLALASWAHRGTSPCREATSRSSCTVLHSPHRLPPSVHFVTKVHRLFEPRAVPTWFTPAIHTCPPPLRSTLKPWRESCLSRVRCPPGSHLISTLPPPLSQVDFEAMERELFEPRAVPTWFTPDFHTSTTPLSGRL